jgi:Secretion system C-terminal sorting domain
MKAIKLIFLLPLFSITALVANNHVFPATAMGAPLGCNLPAPSSITLTNNGSLLVNATWTLVNNAAQYRLQAYDGASGNQLGAPVFVNGSVNTTQISIVGNAGSAYVRIWSVCSNGDVDEEAFTQSNSIDTVIIDVVATGFEIPPLTNAGFVGTTPLTGGAVPWPGALAYFEASYAGKSRIIPMYAETGEDPDILYMDLINESQSNQYLILETGPGEGNQTYLDIKYRSSLQQNIKNAVLVGRIRIAYTAGNNQGFIYKDPQYSAVTVIKKVPNLPLQAPENQGETVSNPRNGVPTTGVATTSPNPFHETLTVKLSETTPETGTTLHLYDLLGICHARIKMPPNQKEYTLSTSNLNPGIYFLQLEVNGTFETLKLLKTP